MVFIMPFHPFSTSRIGSVTFKRTFKKGIACSSSGVGESSDICYLLILIHQIRCHPLSLIEVG